MERENRRNPGRAYQVSEDPFDQILVRLAEGKGFNGPSVLARALGTKKTTVSNWYRDISVPTPAYIGALLIVLNLDESQIDNLINSWSLHLQRGRGSIGSVANTERSFKQAQAHLKQDVDLPLSRWINRITLDRHITQKMLAELLGLDRRKLSFGKSTGFSIFTLGTILENATPALNLTEDEERNLADVVYDTFNQQLAAGRKMLNYDSHQGKNLQKHLSYTTFTGGQAAKELGVSREYIRLQRIKLRISRTLLTEADFEVIKQDLENSRMRRGKRLEAQK